MENLYLSQTPVATAGMLIRKPVHDVYEAFVNPAITTRFWFTHSSGRLEPGKSIRWDWEIYAASTQVKAFELEKDRRILFEWGEDETTTHVELHFEPKPGNATFVSVTEMGFIGNGDQVVEHAMDSTAGFTLVLANLKAWLEHGIQLNLVADRFPDHWVK